MTKKKLFHEIFSCLHASDTVYEEVLEMAQNKGRKKRHFVPKKAVVLCALTIMASSITVLAAAQSGFFQRVFGAKGQENIAAHKLKENNNLMAPARNWENVDEDTAEELIGIHVTPIHRSITVDGYTLTADEYIIDENGIGAITYTLSNPDGLEGISYSEYGGYGVSPDSPLGLISLESVNGKMIDTSTIVDHTQSTETEMHTVLYFVPFEKLAYNEALLMELPIRKWDENGELIRQEKQYLKFTPDSFISSESYTSESGYTAHLSPIGIMFDGPIFETVSLSWIWEKLVITFEDGSVYQVMDTNIANQILFCFSSDTGDSYLVFNRLVDTEQVASITIDGPDGEDMVFTKQ